MKPSIKKFTIALLFIFSPSSFSEEYISISTDILQVYLLHTEQPSMEDIPIPSIYVYDTEKESFLSQKKTIEIIKETQQLDPKILDRLNQVVVSPEKFQIAKKKLAEVSTQITFDTRFLMFYANVGQELLAMFPDMPEAKIFEDKILNLTTKNNEISVYTLN